MPQDCHAVQYLVVTKYAKGSDRVFDIYVFFLTNAVTASPSWSDQASVTMRARMNEDENIFVKWFSQ